jgi:hypothetical protein
LLDDLGDVDEDEGFHLDDTVDTDLPVDFGDEEPDEGEVEGDKDDEDDGDDSDNDDTQGKRHDKAAKEDRDIIIARLYQDLPDAVRNELLD